MAEAEIQQLIAERRRQLAEAYRRYGRGWHGLSDEQHQLIETYVRETPSAVLDKTVAAIFPELYDDTPPNVVCINDPRFRVRPSARASVLAR